MADATVDIRHELAATFVRATDGAATLRMEAARLDEEASRAAAELARLLAEGEAILFEDCEVVLMPARPVGRRSVDKDAIHAHIETLGPLGLGPVEEQRITYRYPSVAELERQSYRLVACGIQVSTLISTPPLGEPRIEVREAKQ